MPSQFETGTYLDEGPPGWDAGGSLTRRDRLYVSPRKLVRIPGRKQEQRLFADSSSGRKSAAEWADFVADIRRKGVTDPIIIHVEAGEGPVVLEGSHRIRAAIQAGRRLVPVEINYFGNAQRSGLVVPPPARRRRTRPHAG